MPVTQTTLDLYPSAMTATRSEEIGFSRFLEICESSIVATLISRFRAGDADAKKHLPAVTFMGKSTTGRRRADDMQPTGLVMLDIDHADDHLQKLIERVMSQDFMQVVQPVLIHITPSGKGLRIVFSAPEMDIAKAQKTAVDLFRLDQYGDFDAAVKDLSRLSFLPQRSDIKFISEALFFDHTPNTNDHERRQDHATEERNPQTDESAGTCAGSETSPAPCSGTGPLAGSNDGPAARLDDGLCGGSAGSSGDAPQLPFCYGGTPVREIAEAYLKWKGEPEVGSRHNFYNGMVLDFRTICNNDPNILIDVLPLVGGDRVERLAQCQGLCKRNNVAKIPKQFYFWLKDNGYYVDPVEKKADEAAEDATDPYAEENEMLEKMPPLPPVFREYISAAPTQFKIPTLFSLLPVMGTLATYLQAEYFDGKMCTPSFMSVITAPPSSGKSFIDRFLEFDPDKSAATNLVHMLLMRDIVSNARYDMWLAFTKNKAGNDKGKSEPKTSKRLMEAITSQADMLPVMKSAQGMHMLMVVPEIDTLTKGMKSGGGGDKNDIFRIAWDNGTYGQSYRSANSFRGRVALYLNLLATGTPAQCERLFKDIENGLITRCCFTDLGNQEFAEYQPWKKFSKKDLQVIENFRTRCDARTYDEPLNFDINTIEEYDTEESFDAAVPWQYHFRGRQTIDLSYINKALLKWLNEKLLIAKKNGDNCMDMWRKRSARKAFNLALLCYACWQKVGKKEEQIIKDFALWFADLDLMKGCKQWGEKYNTFYNEHNVTTRTTKHQTLFDALPDTFTQGDIKAIQQKYSVKTRARNLCAIWKSAGLITGDYTGFTKVKK